MACAPTGTRSRCVDERAFDEERDYALVGSAIDYPMLMLCYLMPSDCLDHDRSVFAALSSFRDTIEQLSFPNNSLRRTGSGLQRQRATFYAFKKSIFHLFLFFEQMVFSNSLAKKYASLHFQRVIMYPVICKEYLT